jgi:peptide/nickel transport system substrate-binding protein
MRRFSEQRPGPSPVIPAKAGIQRREALARMPADSRADEGVASDGRCGPSAPCPPGDGIVGLNLRSLLRRLGQATSVAVPRGLAALLLFTLLLGASLLAGCEAFTVPLPTLAPTVVAPTEVTPEPTETLPPPTATAAGPTVPPSPTGAIPTEVSPTPVIAVYTPQPSATLAPGESPAPPPETAVPGEVIICQQDEPRSLYLYGDSAARAGIFEALFDGPIDLVNYTYKPIILQSLPSLENGGTLVNKVTVKPGDMVVDAVSRQVVPLAQGVRLAQVDGRILTYTGGATATTMQISAAFHLRAGLRWSDGEPLTADDSLFSFEVASSEDTPTGKYIVRRTADYQVEDDLTVRWLGLPGWVDTEFFLRFWMPLPRHLYGGKTPAQLLTDTAANEKPVGWGPFKIQSWQAGRSLVLVRNPNYWRAAEGLPYLSKVTFRFSLSPDQIVTDLQAGRCHIATTETDLTGVIPRLLELKAAGAVTPQFGQSTSFEHLDFNILPADDFDRPAGDDLFQDMRVRKAVALCLDRQALVDQFTYGISEVPLVYLPASHPLFSASQLVGYGFDPALGQTLLEEAGWKEGTDGLRRKGSRTLSVTMISGPPEDAYRQALLEAIRGQLRENCGVVVEIKLLPPEELYSPWPAGPIFGRRYDLALFPWQTGAQPPCDLYMSTSIADDASPGGVNDIGYISDAFDSACQAALSALDEPARRARHAEAQAIFTQDLPSLPLFFRIRVGASVPAVRGYWVDSTAHSDLWNIEAIH